MEALLVSFGVVFVAELGDKTQLVALGLGARYRMLWVFTGVVLAQSVAMAISVLAGGALGAALPERVVAGGAALVFFGFAIWTLRGDGDDDEDEVDPDGSVAPERAAIGIIASVAVAVFIAELGDKTMLAAATLATRQELIWTWVGSTAGVVAAGGVAIVVGNVLGARLPEVLVRRIAAGLFALFGVLLLIEAIRGT